MSVYKDTQRGTWYSKLRYRDWKGEVHWATKRGFSTKREATQWERDFHQRRSKDLSMSFRAFVDVYLEDRTPRLKESTCSTKENIIKNKILPYFGNMAVCDISSTDVVQWQNELLRYRDPVTGKPYSHVYLKTVHNQLSAIFNHAVRFYELQSNPAQKAGNMGKEKPAEPMRFWTQEMYQKFSQVAMEVPLAYYCFQVLYWCGIREGELLALTPEDVDLEKRKLSISKTLQHIHGRDIVTSPKTPKSTRVITMPKFLCDELRDYQKMCYDLHRADRLFPVTKHFLANHLHRFGDRQSLPRIRVHDLRHSHVSLLIHLGFSAAAIAERMGHESIDITYRYAHLFPTVQQEMARQLELAEQGEK